MSETILLIDPAIKNRCGDESPNIGDQIISRAVHRELNKIFDNVSIEEIPSHTYPGMDLKRKVKNADRIIVGGSNLLTFRAVWPTSWKIGLAGILEYKNLILMGVGWGAYDIKGNSYGRWLMNRILSHTHLHSLRDQHSTDNAISQLGIKNSINTACPTMWELTPEHLSNISKVKATRCIFSLTDYAKNPEQDTRLIKYLETVYGKEIYFWPQGLNDARYVKRLGYEGKIIERKLSSFLRLLEGDERFDYVGTRLHAGVLCLEHFLRTLIISVDNRATEIARDTGLPCIDRGDFKGLEKWVEGTANIKINLPEENIEMWKKSLVDIK